MLLHLAALALLAQAPPRTEPLFLDLAGERERQTIVDREAGQYLGHVSTVTLGDGTILAAYPKGHGAGAIVLKHSKDGGKSWSERLPTPGSWASSRETPTLFRVRDPGDGHMRLLCFSGLYPARMAHSDDEGAHWSELEPIGDWGGIVVMGDCVRVGKDRLMAFFHDDGRFLHASGKAEGVFTLLATESSDGGLHWSAPRELGHGSDVHLCEPGCVRSPDGKRLALLLRENKRAKNAHVLFSDDEGAHWTAPRELDPALSGDRHEARYASDGRLVVTFRDMRADSATKGDWVAWVGHFADLENAGAGEYRVRLADDLEGSDCGYAGAERLADGSFLFTSYGHWSAKEPPYILAVHLDLKELDLRRDAPPKSARGPEDVQSADLVLHDDVRRKDLPLRVTWPASPGAHAVVVFSHGLFGSRHGYDPLVQHWASHGYVVVQPSHSDTLEGQSAAQIAAGGTLAERLKDPKSVSDWRGRALDVELVLERLPKLAELVPALGARIDASRVAVAGHSFGAHTTELLAGAARALRRNRSAPELADARPVCFVVLSPQPSGALFDERSFAQFDRPMLFVSGSQDRSPLQDFDPERRKEPFDRSPVGERYLLWIDGADHGLGGVSGAEALLGHRHDDGQLALVRSVTTRFLDAYLGKDAEAKSWLRLRGLAFRGAHAFLHQRGAEEGNCTMPAPGPPPPK